MNKTANQSLSFASAPVCRQARRASAGFTLVELLAVIAVIAVLASLVMTGLGHAQKAASKSREVTAARLLMQAYLTAPADNKGLLVAQSDFSTTAVNEAGQEVHAMAASRWPYRLRSYLGDRFKETLFLNKQADYYDKTMSGTTGFLQDYSLSLGPTFGMNGRFVGGDGAAIMDQPVKRLNAASAPGKLITFASAHDRVATSSDDAGYWKILAPAYWTGSANLIEVPEQKSLDAAYGHVAYRWSGRAVVAYLDGHVDLQSCEELRDMRKWSDAAYRADNPTYVPAAAM